MKWQMPTKEQLYLSTHLSFLREGSPKRVYIFETRDDKGERIFCVFENPAFLLRLNPGDFCIDCVSEHSLSSQQVQDAKDNTLILLMRKNGEN